MNFYNFKMFEWPNRINFNQKSLIISIIFRFITYFYETSVSRNHGFVPPDLFKFPFLSSKSDAGFIVHLGRFMTEPGYFYRKSNQVEIDFNLVEKSTEVWFHQTQVGQFNT